MKKEIKGFITGVIISTLLSTMVFATPIEDTITAFYNDIKVYVDGSLIKPKDADGNIVEPFIYDGTTYLPLRAISQALGKEVDWDSKNNIVYIGKKPNDIENTDNSQNSNSDITEITVGNSQEFYDAIGPNRKILLKPGQYNLSQISNSSDNGELQQYTSINSRGQLTIQNLQNLTIEGLGERYVELQVDSVDNLVLDFVNTDGITLKNIRAGHTPSQYACENGVLSFGNCENITVSKSELYGCGSYGVNLLNVQNANFENTVITQCSWTAMYIESSNNILFKSSKIINHNCESSLIEMDRSYDVTFDDCEISNNRILGEYAEFIFNTAPGLNVKVINSRIQNNICKYFLKNKDDIIIDNTTIENNRFTGGMYLSSI